MSFTLHYGHCIDELRKLPANSVHCVVTSPPYYGLRDYKLPTTVWGDQKCAHAWNADGSCFHCKAWRGCLGLEPSPQLYLEHVVMAFREVRRVLHPSGTIWVNMGDSYCSDAGHNDSSVNRRRGTLGMGERPEHESRRFRVGPDKDPKRGAAADAQPLEAVRTGNGLKAKDLLMMPARVALALQADGWYLRSQIPWVKSSAMPESTEDRPTSALEYVFLLSKSESYFYDKETERIQSSGTSHGRGGGVNPKAMGPNSRMRSDKDPYHQLDSRVRAKQNRPFSAAVVGLTTTRMRRNTDWMTESLRGLSFNEAGEPLAFFVNPQPFSLEMCDQCKAIYPQKQYRALAKNEQDQRVCKCGAVSWVSHFATFPEAIVSPCIRLGTSEYGCCSHCGAPYERIVEKEFVGDWHPNGSRGKDRTEPQRTDAMPRYDRPGKHDVGAVAINQAKGIVGAPATLGWRPTCDHPLYPHEVVPCTVLDPFAGTGRALIAAIKLGRHAIGCELNANYVRMAEHQLRAALPEPIAEAAVS